MKVSKGVGKIAVRGSEKAKERSGEQFTCHRNDSAGKYKHRESGVHDLGSTTKVALSAGDGAERCAAQTEQISEGGNHDDDRKAQSDPAQSGGSFARDPSYVYAVYNAVEEAQHLCDQHGEHALQDIAEDPAVPEIDLFHNRINLYLILPDESRKGGSCPNPPDYYSTPDVRRV